MTTIAMSTMTIAMTITMTIMEIITGITDRCAGSEDAVARQACGKWNGGGWQMKAFVDKDTCVGCSLCIEICPEIFSLGDDGKAETKPGDVPKALEDACWKAVDECPVTAVWSEEILRRAQKVFVGASLHSWT